MSVDKLVDSTQLDSDLTSVANAIRSKTGGSVSLTFPAEFVSAINGIPTGGSLETGSQTITATESSQSITMTPSAGYDGFDEVDITVNAIPSNYVGSGVTQRTSADLIASGNAVVVLAGYYAGNATKTVANGTEGTPTATKSAVSNHAISVTPSVTNTVGFISGGTHTGTAVSVSASELVSGAKSITENGNGVDVTNYASVDVNVPAGITPTGTKNITILSAGTTTEDVTNFASVTIRVSAGSATIPATPVNAPPSISVNAYGQITATVSATQSITPNVSPGYVSTGTSGNITVSGSRTTQMTTQSAQTITPTTTDQTIPSGLYLTGAQTIKGDANLLPENIAYGVTIFGVTGTYQGGAITYELDGEPYLGLGYITSITLDGTYGTGAGYATAAEEGDTVTVMLGINKWIPEFKRKDTNEPIPTTTVTTRVYSFTMPASDVWLDLFYDD